MKSSILYVVSVLLFFTVSCESTTDANINEKTERVAINNSEVFEYQTGISGDEERARVTQQAEHHHISEIVRDSTTDWEAVYRYQAEEGYEGKDRVEIKVKTGSDGASPSWDIAFITIEFTVKQ